jgi:hypothetical protein
MKLKAVIAGLLVGLLVGCSDTTPEIKQTTDAIGKAAKLTPEQIKSLISAENSQIVPASQSNIKPQKVKTILPTYVPPGFKVDEFKINPCDQGTGTSSRYTYRITYRNSSNASFNIDNYFICSQGGDDSIGLQTLQIPSKKFDRVTINYTKFDKIRNSPYVKGEVTSPSPDYPGSDRLLLFFEYYNNPLNLAEARKIIESMEYLNNEK